MDLMELRDRVAQAVREGRLAGRHVGYTQADSGAGTWKLRRAD